ncbi:O-antigen ligase family protein [Haladaptatus caseinilyticus]|uniref:O-antigen ligase family protein n=1 Tax=Haladaptatus caseinilyticus TaxID=2993314 RepID=UPI00224B8591|nr:O-antigen ligase family protein [Haladaptatus caseinilyticus]
MSLQDQQKTSTSLSLNPLTGEFRPIALLQILLIPLLFVDILLRASNSPEQYGSFHLNMLYLYFVPLLLLMRSYYSENRDLWLHVAQISALILLTFIFLRQRNKYIPAEGRTVHVALIFLLYVLYPLISHNFMQFLRSRAVYIGSYVTILGVFFYHVNEMSAGSTRASFVVYMGLIFGLNLFFIPRYVSRDVFLWGISSLSSFIVVLGLPAYLIGEFNLSWLQISLYQGTFALPIFGTEVHFFQSIFTNPNTVGGLTFAGAFGALALIGENIRRKRLSSIPIAGAMLIVSTLGLFLSYSRASWLAFGIASTLYLAYLILGRRSVPYTAIAVGVLTVLFLGGILFSVIPISANGRFELWKGGIRAILRAPSSFGYGVVNTHELIAPFVTDPAYRGYSPHNSYVEIFLNTGIVGGVAYLILMGGSILEGIIRRKTVDVPIFAFAFGFAVHQAFEVYTMFNVAVSAILATLVVGYLICGYQK